MAAPDATLREMLIEVAPPALRAAGRALVAAEAALAGTSLDPEPGMAYAEALTTWGDLGGYELEAQWASAVQRVVKSPVDDVSTRRVGELSGGERKRLVLDLVLNSGADVLLLDEPDNYLDIPTRWWLEEQLRQTKSTVLMVSHDRAVLDAVATKVIAIEGSGAWVHGGSFATFPQARAERQERLGDALAAVERRGAAALSPHEDHEAARCGELQERLEGQRRRDALGEVRRGRPAAAAGARSADQRRAARRRLRPARRADDRRDDRRPLLPVQRRDLLR